MNDKHVKEFETYINSFDRIGIHAIGERFYTLAQMIKLFDPKKYNTLYQEWLNDLNTIGE